MTEAPTNRDDGLTLLEVVVAAGLAGLLAAVAAPRLASLAHGVRLAGAAHTLAGAFRLARGRAIARNGGIEVRFDAARGVVETRAVSGSPLGTLRLPAGITFAALPARGRIRFAGLGTADNGTVVLAGGTRRRRVIVNQRGRVSIR